MAKLRLMWPIDLKGYLVEPIRPRSGPTLAEGGGGDDRPGEGLYVIRNGGKLDFQDRLKIDGLWRKLAETEPTKDGALEFVSHYGFLWGNRREESVVSISNEIKVMRSLVAAIDRHDWPILDLWLLDNRKAIRLHPEFQQDEEWSNPGLFFRPGSLRDAIFLQALEDVTRGTELWKCQAPGCREYRRVGPGTGRWKPRNDAHGRRVFYCSPKCQKSHQYLKRKGKSK